MKKIKFMIFAVLALTSTTFPLQNELGDGKLDLKQLVDKQIKEIEGKNSEEKTVGLKEEKNELAELDGIIFKGFLIVEIAFIFSLFIIWRRREVRHRVKVSRIAAKTESKIEPEKLEAKDNQSKRKTRKKLLSNSKLLNLNNKKELSQKAKEMSIAKEEILLASRINSHQMAQ